MEHYLQMHMSLVCYCLLDVASSSCLYCPRQLHRKDIASHSPSSPGVRDLHGLINSRKPVSGQQFSIMTIIIFCRAAINRTEDKSIIIENVQVEKQLQSIVSSSASSTSATVINGKLEIGQIGQYVSPVINRAGVTPNQRSDHQTVDCSCRSSSHDRGSGSSHAGRHKRINKCSCLDRIAAHFSIWHREIIAIQRLSTGHGHWERGSVSIKVPDYMIAI